MFLALSKQTKQRGERDIHTHAGKILGHQLKTYTVKELLSLETKRSQFQRSHVSCQRGANSHRRR